MAKSPLAAMSMTTEVDDIKSYDDVHDDSPIMTWLRNDD